MRFESMNSKTMWNLPQKNITQQISCRQFKSHNVGYDVVVKRLKKSFEANSDNGFLWDNPVFASQFCPMTPNSNILAAANECGQVLLWNVKRGLKNSDQCMVTQCHDNAIFDLAWSYRDPKFLTVSGDHTVVLWDFKDNLSVEKVGTLRDCFETVKSCAWDPEHASIFASGNRGGVVFIWDARTHKAENKINRAHERELYSTPGKPITQGANITGLSFFQDHFLVTASAGDTTLQVWDLRKHYAAYKKKPVSVQKFKNEKYPLKNGYAYLLMDYNRNILYATSANNRIYSFAMNTSSVIGGAIFVGGEIRSFYQKSSLSSDGNYLISGSNTEYALIWNTNENRGKDVCPTWKLKTRGKEVNTVSWCKSPGDEFKIATFAECEPGEIWDVNPHTLSQEEWETPLDLDDSIDAAAKQEDYLESVTADNVNQSITPQHHVSRPFIVYCNGENLGSRFFDSASRNERKRNFSEMLENDVDENQRKKIKFRHTLSPRRLFPGYDTTEPKGKDKELLVCPQSPNVTDSKHMDLLEDVPGKGFPLVQKETENIQQDSNESSINVPFSPTSNLPNYVVDGTSPIHVCKPHKKRHVDWLTQLRHGVNTDVNNINNHNILTETNAKKSDMPNKSKQKQPVSILKFFRVLGKPSD